MRLLLLISVSLLLAWQAARAQTADNYFNRGAHAYISNNIPQALESVEAGLKSYPDDVKLKKLYELLKQQSQQQSQNNQSQKNQNRQSQPNQSQQPQSQKNQQNRQQSQSSSPPQKQSQQAQSGQKNAEPQNQRPQQAAGEKQNNQNSQNQPVPAGQMTPEEAKRLLDAQKGDEQFLQLKPQTPPQNSQPPIEDW